jgi:hypothetical protein
MKRLLTNTGLALDLLEQILLMNQEVIALCGHKVPFDQSLWSTFIARADLCSVFSRKLAFIAQHARKLQYANFAERTAF